MHAEELCGIELVLERLHRLTDQIAPFADNQLGVRPARGDVVDFTHGDESDFASRLDADAIDVSSRRLEVVGDLDRGRGLLLENGQQALAEPRCLARSGESSRAVKGLLESVV